MSWHKGDVKNLLQLAIRGLEELDTEERDVWYVESDSTEGVYYRVTHQSCTCPHFRYHPNTACKHMAVVP